MNEDTDRLYTLKQLRQAWGAGKAQMRESFETFFQDEINRRVDDLNANTIETMCDDCIKRNESYFATLYDESLDDVERLQKQILMMRAEAKRIDTELQEDGDRLSERTRTIFFFNT